MSPAHSRPVRTRSSLLAALCVIWASTSGCKDANQTPTAADVQASTTEDQPVVLLLDGSNEDGDSLTYTVQAPPAHGTLGDIEGDSVTYTPDADFNGVDAFSYTVSDGTEESEPGDVTISIEPVNDAPVADDDATPVVDEDDSSGVAITLVGTDVDAGETATLTYTVLTEPTHGSLTGVAPDLVYTPTTPQWSGADSFTFKVTDTPAAVDSNTATINVTVTPVNDAPVAFAGDDQIAVPGQLVTLYGSSTDVEDDDRDFYWLQTSGPLVDFDATAADPIFRAWSAGALEFELVVDDGDPSAPDTVVVAVYAPAGGGDQAGMVKPDGTMWAWGSYSVGIGDGTDLYRDAPVQVLGADGTTYDDDWAAIAPGSELTLALKQDGTVWAWGDDHGFLGDGAEEDRYTPVQVCDVDQTAPCSSHLSDVIAVGAKYFGVALKSDGTVWAWGEGYDGQTGNGTFDDAPTPVQVCDTGETAPCGSFFTDVVAIAVGGYHALALKPDGTVWGWGSNSAGTVGDGTINHREAPVQVCAANQIAPCTSFLTDIVAISAGNRHSLALGSDGTVWGWGANNHGRLGDGTEDQREVPVQVCAPGDTAPCTAFLTNVVSLAAGNEHSQAVKSDGTLWTWGSNEEGELGDGCVVDVDCADSWTPIQVGAETDWFAVLHGGSQQSLAMKDDATLWSWGDNGSGQLGDDSAFLEVPTRVGEADDWIAVSLVDNHALALREEGGGGTTLWAWGENRYGEVGNDCTFDTDCVYELVPVQVLGADGQSHDDDWEAISAGYGNHSLARKDTGTLWAWGRNDSGQLGNGDTTTDWPIPMQVLEPDGATYEDDWGAASTGGAFTVALKSDKTVWSWGHNNYGQLGNGEQGHSTREPLPVQVCAAGETHPCGAFLTGVDVIRVGSVHSLALTATHALYAWGNGDKGELGDGNDTDSYVPVQVLGADGVNYDSDWEEIVAGRGYNLARKQDNSVWSWGSNSSGQLGLGTDAPSHVSRPFPVCELYDTLGTTCTTALTEVVAIAAGADHSLAVKEDGTLWAWGDNEYGELGVGNESEWEVPVQVGTDTDWKAVSASYYRSAARKDDDSLWVWGRTHGLGHGFQTTVPVQVSFSP
ncbi:MAG: tandem-95 repeat protein [Deltaproteobacteria bacterium]|nr:tandem-95 repeat protein [Deltaproteobacteria bacterium]